jgi:cellulose synthase/poly-beta-1,6-N-acetylglucosamine synthase-like glycosyltransferase
MHHMASIDAVVVAKDTSEVLLETIEGLRTYPFCKVIVVTAKNSEKPEWCDILVVDKGRLGKARNTGVDLANSEFICMVDSDIILNKNYTETLLEIFKDSKVAAVGGKLESYTKSLYALVKAQVFRGYCKVHSDVPCGGTIYRASVLKKERFNDLLAGGEDHELHVRLKKRNYKVIYTEKASCFHYYKGNMKKEVFLCMISGARTGLLPTILRAVIAPFRSLLLMTACRDNIYSLFIPPFYVTQWIAHVFGALFTEEEIKAKIRALD